MRLNCVILQVGTPDDLAASRRWYEQLLGLHVNSEIENHSVWLDVGAGAEIGLHVGEPVDSPERLTVGLHVDDVDQTYEYLRARGIEFDGPPETRDWGRRAAATDPTGHTVCIVSG
jgi:lactoylglutathione lyase